MYGLVDAHDLSGASRDLAGSCVVGLSLNICM